MQFVAGPVNNVLLRDVLHGAITHCSQVRAAVAYANANTGYVELFEACKCAGKQLTYYGRYDETVPVSPEVLYWFLAQRSPALVCKLVPDILHAKVIWWEGVGVYIGSANLSDRAWYSNIEAGVFVEESDLDENGFRDELVNFFDVLETHAIQLDEGHYTHLKQVRDERLKRLGPIEAALRTDFEEKRKSRIPRNDGLYAPVKRGADKRRAEFIREWGSTLQLMRDLAFRVSEPANRPDWIEPNTPEGLQADQFLHAYYFQRVRDGKSYPVESLYQQNHLSREAALAEAFDWWKNGWKWSSGGYKYTDEEAALQRAPLMQANLSKSEIRGLSQPDFTAVAKHIYALRDYAFRQPSVSIGLAPNVRDYELKAEAFARCQYPRKSAGGKSILETIYFVLYGGSDADIALRLWDAVEEPRWRIQGMGISTLGEMAGWALPNRFPPRNGRTSKALRALGYDVAVPK
jgi:hypothetical protein